MSFRVAPRGGAGGRGVGEGLEGQRTLPGAEVCVGQGGVQREQVGWWGQDLGPLGIGENWIVCLIWQRKEEERKTDDYMALTLTYSSSILSLYIELLIDPIVTF